MRNVSQISGKPNKQSERTKTWIFDALLLLMDEKPYAKINISDITKRAGIARTTFYRNYENKNDIVFDYFKNTMSIKSLNTGKTNNDNRSNTIIITLDYKYITEHKKNLQKIFSNTDIETSFIRHIQKLPIALIEHLKKNLSKKEYLYCRFKLCYQITGSIRVITDWFINNMPIPIDEFILMINTTNNPRIPKYPGFPSIMVQLKEE